jgi:Glycosyl transferases group 1
MLLVDATYIHNGGGRILLNYLLNKLLEQKNDTFFLLDNRCDPDFDFIASDKKMYLKTNLWTRYQFYLNHRQQFSKVICLGNLPPPISLKAQVYTYFHNLIYIDYSNYRGLDKAILILKSWYIQFYLKNTDYVCVQTNLVKRLFCQKYNYAENQCIILPFFENFVQSQSSNYRKKEHFLYVSDGNTHKNHGNLLRAWEIVNQQNSELELHLTVSEIYPALVATIKKYQSKGLNIINHGKVSQQFLNQLYQQSEYIIYPSLTESFGLGLIEGVLAGCKPIVSDRPYSFAVIEPFMVFNPLDFEDIANTILQAYYNTQAFEKQDIKARNEIEKLIHFLS